MGTCWKFAIALDLLLPTHVTSLSHCKPQLTVVRDPNKYVPLLSSYASFPRRHYLQDSKIDDRVDSREMTDCAYRESHHLASSRTWRLGTS
jgi:hypothetical protein